MDSLYSNAQVALTEVYVSEVTEEGKFYACNVSDGPALETLMDGLRSVISCSHLIVIVLAF